MNLRRYLNLLIFIILLVPLSCRSSDTTSLMDGDIIFHESQSSLGPKIEQATGSSYTHMGILFSIKGKWYVYEAVQPVGYASLESFIDRGVNDHYVIKRLSERSSLLTKDALSNMIKIGKSFTGKNYDSYFQWSDKRMYCSELVWKIYFRGAGIDLVPLKTMSDFNLDDPVVHQFLTGKYGSNIPRNEKVVAPVDILESDLLETVVEKN